MQPVKKQLKRFIVYFQNDEEYMREYEALVHVSKSEQWQIVTKILWSIKNEMAIELLQSSKYTKGDLESKDVTQKVYHNISEWIDFLVNPALWVKKKGKIQMLTQKFKGEVQSKPERRNAA